MNRIKNIILNIGFIRDHIQYQIKASEMSFHTKNFKAAQDDILETMRDDLDAQAEILAKEKVSQLLSVVDTDKIVTIDKAHGIVFVGGTRIDENRLANLKAESEFFMQSDLWSLIYETPKELAQRSMFVMGESLADLQKGKSMLYTLSSQKNIIDMFLSYKKK